MILYLLTILKIYNLSGVVYTPLFDLNVQNEKNDCSRYSVNNVAVSRGVCSDDSRFGEIEGEI